MSSETLNSTGAFSQAKDLKNRILFTILILVIYRLGTYVPLSGIDPLALKEKNLINKKYLKLKILGSGEIKKNLEISAHFASNQALTKIEKAGGKINIVKK